MFAGLHGIGSGSPNSQRQEAQSKQRSRSVSAIAPISLYGESRSAGERPYRPPFFTLVKTLSKCKLSLCLAVVSPQLLPPRKLRLAASLPI